MHCWASILGDCDGKQSGEHIVSKGLFRGNVVRVRGFKWCQGEFKTIGLKGLKAKVLCKHHNGLLSPLDTEAIRLQKHLSEFTGEVEDVYGGEGLWRGPTHFEIDGEKIARWNVKTHCGFYADARLPVPEEWVRYAFGRDGAERPWVFVREPRRQDWEFANDHVAQYRDFPFIPEEAEGTALELHAAVYCRFHGIEFLVAPAAVGPWLFDVLQQVADDPAMFVEKEWAQRPDALDRHQRAKGVPPVLTRKLSFRWP